MSKVAQIKKFIDENNPTRKEIVKFIIVNLGSVKEEDYNASNYKGHYSTNFTQWKTNGHVQTDAKHRYSLTELGKKSTKSLYSLPLEVQLDRANRRNDRLSENMSSNHRLIRENRRLQALVDDLAYKLDAIERIIG
jgi:hypothetical protein